MNRSMLLTVLIALGLIISGCSTPTDINAEPTLTDTQSQGKRLFSIHCAACHTTTSDTVIVGPPLAGISQRAGNTVEGLDAKTYIEMSITHPDAYIVEGYAEQMPNTFAKQLTTIELDALVDFLLTR